LELLAGRAAVSEKIGFGLDWMGLTADQSHQAAATLAKKGRQVFGVLGFDVFHAATTRRRITSVNSVSLQPKFTPISALARTGAFALPRAFGPASAFVPIDALEPFQTMAVK
jgi:hypothetical protein